MKTNTSKSFRSVKQLQGLQNATTNEQSANVNSSFFYKIDSPPVKRISHQNNYSSCSVTCSGDTQILGDQLEGMHLSENISPADEEICRLLRDTGPTLSIPDDSFPLIKSRVSLDNDRIGKTLQRCPRMLACFKSVGAAGETKLQRNQMKKRGLERLRRPSLDLEKMQVGWI